MRLGRGKAQASKQVTLPAKGESLVLNAPGSPRIPARVLERSADSVVVAVTVPISPLSPAQLAELELEYNSSRGRMRLEGRFELADPSDPEVVRLVETRKVELVQVRNHVRVDVSRPVVLWASAVGGRIETFTVDLSGGGFQLAGPDTLPVGEELRFRLSLGPDEEPVSGAGKVVRITPQGRRGVHFESISDLDRRRIVRFLFEVQRDERKRGLTGDA
jgi:PilZ domain